MITKLRECDAFLLKHYNHQSKKRNSSFLRNTVARTIEREESGTPAILQEVGKKGESGGRKKKLVEIVGEGVRMSDYQLKPNQLVSIEVYVHKDNIIGLMARY